MEAFYSVIYIKTTPLTDERIAVGLLGGGGDGPFVYFSDSKLRVAQYHFDKDASNNLKKQLRYFKDLAEQYREQRSDALLFDPHFSVEQLQSIGEKTKGAIIFSMPVTINEDMTAVFFSALKEKIIGKEMRKSIVDKTSTFLNEWKKWQKSIEKNDNYRLNIDAAEISNTITGLVKIPVYHIANKCCFFPWDSSATERKQKTIISSLMLLISQIPTLAIVLVVNNDKDIKTVEKSYISSQFQTKIKIKSLHSLQN
jgi:hypothetical protein